MVASIRGIAATLTMTALCAAALAGCAGPSAPDADPDTIAESKGATQLIRSLALETIPEDELAGEPAYEDGTVACASASFDPDGLQRWWRSTAILQLVEGADGGDIQQHVIDDMVERGWSAGEISAGQVVQLAHDTTSAKVTVGVVPKGGHAELSVTVDGPCVATQGPESDEVKRAEGRLDDEDEKKD